MAAVLIRRHASEKSRLRLFVVQALVLSLFVTLFARLWYMQVLTGEGYQAAAAEQSVREVVVQPARGLVVDDMGRPLVANRSSWVVTVDRTLVGKLDEERREAVLRRLARVVDVDVDTVEARMVLCGQEGSVAGTCWNGSPYQPVPVATDVDQDVAVKLLERTEEFPGVLAQQENVRAYPAPYGINAAHVLGYLSPITGGELEEAEADGDTSVNGASVVGRSGVEKSYDAELRGTPGYTQVTVDSQGRVLGESGEVDAVPGSTLVTSIDAKVQSVVEKQLADTIATARGTVDPVTGRTFVADSGAAVVLDVRTGRIVAIASQPTYDPTVWSGGIKQEQLDRLYSEEAGTPLLSRATQGQFAPGSTWKPFVTAGAMMDGYGPGTVLPCSSSFQVGNRAFKNMESASHGYIDFAKALEVSCNTFFYRIGFDEWQKYGSDPSDMKAKDPLVSMAKTFGFGATTGVDLPSEASGRIADRRWKKAYYEQMKDYYCELGEEPGEDFQHRFAREFCQIGNEYRVTDAVNFSIGQGDTVVTPLQLARGYAALGNGGVLYEPRVAKAVVSPDGEQVREIAPEVQAELPVRKDVLAYIDDALERVTTEGTMAWRMEGFPNEQVKVRSKTGSAEVYGKQSTSWVASYNDDYAVVMMVSQGGTGSGTSGPAIRKIWESLYGVQGDRVVPGRAAIAGTRPPKALPTFAEDGSILPPAREEEVER